MYGEWNKLDNIPKHISVNTVASLNNDEFLVGSRKVPGIHKYNFEKQEWTEFINHSDKFNIHQPQINVQSVNGEIKKLYMFGIIQNVPSLVSIDMQTKEFGKTVITSDVHSTRSNVAACFISDNSGYIHIIGGWKNNKHTLFNTKDNSFKYIHEFTEFERIYGPAAVYIPSKNSILLIGGETGTYVDNMVNIRIYSLQTKQWKLLPNIMFGYYHIRAILTRDEKHV
eukprot:111877_1